MNFRHLVCVAILSASLGALPSQGTQDEETQLLATGMKSRATLVELPSPLFSGNTHLSFTIPHLIEHAKFDRRAQNILMVIIIFYPKIIETDTGKVIYKLPMGDEWYLYIPAFNVNGLGMLWLKYQNSVRAAFENAFVYKGLTLEEVNNIVRQEMLDLILKGKIAPHPSLV